jgi:hypothetical protein
MSYKCNLCAAKFNNIGRRNRHVCSARALSAKPRTSLAAQILHDQQNNSDLAMSNDESLQIHLDPTPDLDSSRNHTPDPAPDMAPTLQHNVAQEHRQLPRRTELAPSRSGRRRFANSRIFHDYVLSSATRAAEDSLDLDSYDEPVGQDDDTLVQSMNIDSNQTKDYFTVPDDYGVYRQYPHKPSIDPDKVIPIERISDAPALERVTDEPRPNWWSGMTRSLLAMVPKNPFAPLSSVSVYRLLAWFHNSDTKSIDDIDDLVHKVLLAPDFDLHDAGMQTFSTQKELRKLDTAEEFSEDDGWVAATVELPVPVKDVRIAESATPHRFRVPGLYYRRMVDVIRSFFSQAPVGSVHLTPFKTFWDVGHGVYEQLYNKVFNSKAMYEEHEKIQADVGRTTDLEIVIAAIMLWSDSTHLANFGTAALWPVYMFFGNVSKYFRSRPSSFMAQHIAYLPKVSCSLLYRLYLTDNMCSFPRISTNGTRT